ncbi:hypothetical protein DM02DRAFT_694075 [Periconia macrospinosa]|uniref:BZIP domain-containing protein n=1 Tax=Periconia macrospinosa TaxID=97972 RepID=A0A2V1DAA4_9PLEO|nr:hypothetical protein DM02DRAFT_694075 [Periconia macrospinosa]
MNIDQLLTSSNTASPAHVTTSVQRGPTLPAVAQQNNAEQHPYEERLASAAPHGASTNSQPFAAPVQHTSLTIEPTKSTQIKEFKDQQGRSYRLPVYVYDEAADLKRRRNATASARFRQKKKIRVLEAEQKVKQLEEELERVKAERDLYKAERDLYKAERDVYKSEREYYKSLVDNRSNS